MRCSVPKTDPSPKGEKSTKIHLAAKTGVLGVYLQLNPFLPRSRMLFLLLRMRKGWLRYMM